MKSIQRAMGAILFGACLASVASGQVEPQQDCPSCGCCRTCSDPDEPWTLIGDRWCGLNLGGWISAGVYANAWGTSDNGALGSKSVGDGFTVDQLWFFAEKTVDTEGGGWDWGGRVDYVFGVDAPDIQAFGDQSWDFGWNTSRDYGSAIPQAYLEVGYGNLKVKGGHFLTPIGWEYIEDPPNFFSSHSYAYYYAEPATHTGVLATYELGESLTVQAGWTDGWDSGFANRNGASTFIGGASWDVCDRLTAVYACSAGDFGGVDEGDVYMHSIALEFAVTERIDWIIHHDLGVQSNLPASGNALWTGVVQYLQYEINDRWAAGIRFEWFQDRDAARVDPGLIAGNFYELTAGLNWKPHPNLNLRPEIRYDWFDGTFAPGNLPFDDGQEDHQLSAGFDVIVTF